MTRREAVTTEYRFTVVLEAEEDGGFTVRVPALPEAIACGDTEEEALAMAEEAIRLAIEHRRDNDEPVPEGARMQLREVTVMLPA